MIKVDNSSFLKFLEDESIILNFYTCDNIVNAGKPGYAIKSISFFTADGKPSNSYVSFSENIYDELIVEIKTADPALIEAVLCETKRNSDNYKNIRFDARVDAFFDSPVFKKYFKVKKTYAAEYAVFAQLSKNDLPAVAVPENISVALVPEAEIPQYADYDDVVWDGLASMIRYGTDTDRLYVLKTEGAVCGYLMANNSYKNIYDIANVFVLEKYRGNNFGVFLTVTFAKDCYANGLIPHYGTPVSDYSRAVAVRSGFTEIYRRHFADVKAKLF